MFKVNRYQEQGTEVRNLDKPKHSQDNADEKFIDVLQIAIDRIEAIKIKIAN